MITFYYEELERTDPAKPYQSKVVLNIYLNGRKYSFDNYSDFIRWFNSLDRYTQEAVEMRLPERYFHKNGWISSKKIMKQIVETGAYVSQEQFKLHQKELKELKEGKAPAFQFPSLSLPQLPSLKLPSLKLPKFKIPWWIWVILAVILILIVLWVLRPYVSVGKEVYGRVKKVME